MNDLMTERRSGHAMPVRFPATAILLCVFACGPAHAYEQWHDEVDYTRLKNALGAALPTGSGVPVAQIESPGGGGNPATDPYYVDESLPEFNGFHDPSYDPELGPNASRVNFTNGTGLQNGISLHTNNVGARFYGDLSSAAPGTNNVTIYEANHWMTSVLKYDKSPDASPHPGPPLAQGFRVENHSWIGTFAPGMNPVPWAEDPQNVDVLRRYDYLIDTANGGRGLTAAVGVANNQNPLPYLLSHSYNALVVGRSDGFHASGLTLAPDGTPPDASYGPGRSKPDIVAPKPSPSFGASSSMATAMVSSAATLLWDAAENTPAAQSEVIKAILMAGATKEWAGWTRTATQPLDDTYGAGELNIYNSYLSLLGGQYAGSANQPTTSVGSYGWDYQDFKSNESAGDLFYNFFIPNGSKATELSIVLAWNVEIIDDDPSSGFKPSQSLQNLDLAFYDSTSSFMGSLVDQSISSVDNVEHIYRTTVDPGLYTLKVSGAGGWDFGLAWRMSTLFNVSSADFDGSGSVDGADFLIWQQNAGMLIGASHGQGDANGDGAVDRADLKIYQGSLMPVMAAGQTVAGAGGAASGAASPVPEPTTIMSFVAACFAAAGSSRLRSRILSI